MKKLVSLFLALLMVLSFGLLTAAAAEPKEIVFWTALAGAYNDVIQNICADFNATQDEWKVVPEYQGNYYDIAAKLQASLTSCRWSAAAPRCSATMAPLPS